MNKQQLLNLGLGDSVNWIDPDGIDSGNFTIAEVMSDNGRVKGMDTVVVIMGESGFSYEAYVSELS